MQTPSKTADSSQLTKAQKRAAQRREWLQLTGLLILLAGGRDALANHYLVPSGSMEPTLVPGDRVMVDMRAYGWRLPFTHIELFKGEEPRAGDVAVFDSPDDGTRLIKRVVAVEGDTVALIDGRLQLNGQWLHLDDKEASNLEFTDVNDAVIEQFGDKSITLNLQHGGGPNISPMVVPQGQALVVGDHRGNSKDSRYFGFVDLDKIYGKARGVFYRSDDGFTWVSL